MSFASFPGRMMRMPRESNKLAVGLAGVLALGALVGCTKATLGDAGVAGASGQISGAGNAPGGRGGTPDDAGWISTGGAVATGGVSGSGGLGGRGAAPGRGGTGGGGTGGAPGRGGAGGAPLIWCPEPDPPACGTLCGNGLIDTCTRARDLGCISYMLTEQCDGFSLGGHEDDCAALGFASGKTVCDSNCLADTRTCSECVQGLPSLLACGASGVVSSPESLGPFVIDATDTEVGIAVLEWTDPDHARLSFARLTPSLEVASNVTLIDTALPGPLAGAYPEGVALAPVPSGWMIATCAQGDLHIYTVDATGGNPQRLAAPILGDGSLCSFGVWLVARPGGGPLLTWIEQNAVAGALINTETRTASAPFNIIGISETDSFDAAWVGDAFQFAAATVAPDTLWPQLRLIRIGLDGSLTGRDVLTGEFGGVPLLTRGAPDVRITFVGSLSPGSGNFDDVGIRWRRIGAMGELGAGATLGRLSNYWVASPSVAIGDDTVVLTSADDGASLVLRRLGAQGQAVTVPYAILRAPDIFASGHQLVRRGPDVIAAWYSRAAPGQISLARIVP
jgi:hypothetical protein